MVGEASHGDVGEVAALSVLPFFVLFEQDGADETGDGITVGEDLDDVSAAFDLGVDAFDRVVRPYLLPVLGREGGERGEIRFGVA